jgi:hypothetical protein
LDGEVLSLAGLGFCVGLDYGVEKKVGLVFEAELDAELEAEFEAELDAELEAEFEAEFEAELDAEFEAEFEAFETAPFLSKIGFCGFIG